MKAFLAQRIMGADPRPPDHFFKKFCNARNIPGGLILLCPFMTLYRVLTQSQWNDIIGTITITDR
jgi:hypothetical protein